MEAQNTEFAYDATPSGRFLILNDIRQEMPKEHMKVVGASTRKSGSGRDYPVLTLEADDGAIYEVAAWERDVKACISEYGGKPLTWGPVRIEVGATRSCLVPVGTLEKNTKTETVR